MTDFDIVLHLFEDALEKISRGEYEKEAAIIRQKYKAKPKAPFDMLIQGFLAGIGEGLDLMAAMAAMEKMTAANGGTEGAPEEVGKIPDTTP